MRSVNKVFLIGAVGGDAKSSASANGLSFLNFSLATNKKIKVNGEYVDKTNWHQCVCFDKVAEAMAKFIKKGVKLHIEGEVDYSEYEKDGVKRQATKIICNQVTILDFKNDEKVEAEEIRDSELQRNYKNLEDEIPF